MTGGAADLELSAETPWGARRHAPLHAFLDNFMNFRAHLFLEELYFDRRGCVFLQSDGVPEESRNQARFRGLLSESVPSSG